MLCIFIMCAMKGTASVHTGVKLALQSAQDAGVMHGLMLKRFQTMARYRQKCLLASMATNGAWLIQLGFIVVTHWPVSMCDP